MTYVHIPYELLTMEQHNDMLRKNLSIVLNYLDGETFKTIIIGQDNNYLLQFIHERKKETGGKL